MTKGVARLFVLDASVTAARGFADERSELENRALERLDWDSAVVPAMGWYEIPNVMVIGERRGRICAKAAAEFPDELEALPINIDGVRRTRPAWNLAKRHRLTIYDASYLEIVIRQTLPIATLDRALIAAAQAESVELLYRRVTSTLAGRVHAAPTGEHSGPSSEHTAWASTTWKRETSPRADRGRVRAPGAFSGARCERRRVPSPRHG